MNPLLLSDIPPAGWLSFLFIYIFYYGMVYEQNKNKQRIVTGNSVKTFLRLNWKLLCSAILLYLIFGLHSLLWQIVKGAIKGGL